MLRSTPPARKRIWKVGRPFFFLRSVLLVLITTTAYAQFWPTDTAGGQGANGPQWLPDSLDRRTPRGTVVGFLKAVADENYLRASRYLSLERKVQGKQAAAERAQALQRLLDQRGNITAYSRISNNPNGDLDDHLGPNLERVGVATANGETFDLILEKTEAPGGGPLWLFSSQTVQQVPILAEEEEIQPVTDRILPTFLKKNRWGGVPIGHWFVMLVLAVLAYLLAWGITLLVRLLTKLVWVKARTEPTAGIIKAFELPIRLYIAVWVLVMSSQAVGISIIVRQRFSDLNLIIAQVALILLLWRLTDFITGISERRLTMRGNASGLSALLFLRRGLKIALLCFGVIAVLGTIGFDVTTGLAALGIGGIALALGAQKTVENFVGSVTLIADQPVRVGDFCKVGDTIGTVEQIGMRSTRIRTLNRTIVTIPNGEFSSLRIENFAHRDRFWFHPIFKLRYETTPEQIRFLLVELRSVLYSHPRIDPDPARVRFIEFGEHSLNIEIFAYVYAKDFSEFLEIQEDLYLRMMDIIKASGTGFAFPSQTLYMARDTGPSEEKTKTTEEQVRQWRESGELQLPNFSEERIKALKNSIPYPPNPPASAPNGTSQATKKK